MTYDVDRILYIIFIMQIANLCLTSAILLILTRMASKKRFEDAEKLMMRFLIIISLIFAIGLAQEEDDLPIIILPDKPVIFPEAMEKASLTICVWFQNATGSGNSSLEKLTIDEYLNMTNQTWRN